MRIAIVSDVHANFPALESVLQHAEQRSALDAVWSLGDLVGYGPQPNEVIERLRPYDLSGVLGNHDAAAARTIGTDDFNPEAATAIAWNAGRLSPENSEFLARLPEVATLKTQDAVLCHGSLRWPIWEYLFTYEAAQAQFAQMDGPISFVGHTHIPLIFEEVDESDAVQAFKPGDRELVPLEGRRLILNPGGVGQPRDGDPRAAYAVLDTAQHTVEFHRVPYPVKETQALMVEAGLPMRLVTRLARGR